ncbi:AFR005Cp [Eremothecium gossypii ATCC 10895]|uniref:AFR005Cp n=1 Tax=Eremothecium gossypii (strain ATCC 10895 / CBS 109.51 / FGSC 9923 / NRRL Y-1056) TaxID=284811 RepID=Q754R7_EREGS|nr:AFR005Cp [Eremothecium gossypii ATCC 10895]AAS53376.1 AFR005Cp [Eremothecium gossypii ATCC 10895]AEY97687.1 FAFR005Cp [Eremothecium gossypii FDAG1]
MANNSMRNGSSQLGPDTALSLSASMCPEHGSASYNQITLKEKLREHFRMPAGFRQTFKQTYYEKLRRAQLNLVHASESYHDACEGARFKFYRALADTRQVLHEMRDAIDNIRVEAQLWRYDHINAPKLDSLFRYESLKSRSIIHRIGPGSGDEQRFHSGEVQKDKSRAVCQAPHPSPKSSNRTDTSDNTISLTTDEDAFEGNDIICSAPLKLPHTDIKNVDVLHRSASAPVELINDSDIYLSRCPTVNDSANSTYADTGLHSRVLDSETQIETVRKITDIMIRMFDEYMNDNNLDTDQRIPSLAMHESRPVTFSSHPTDLVSSNDSNTVAMPLPRPRSSVCNEIDRLNSMIESAISIYNRYSEEGLQSSIYNITDANDQNTNQSLRYSALENSNSGFSTEKSNSLSLRHYPNEAMGTMKDILDRVVNQLNQFEGSETSLCLPDSENSAGKAETVGSQFLDPTLKSVLAPVVLQRVPEGVEVPLWCTVRHTKQDLLQIEEADEDQEATNSLEYNSEQSVLFDLSDTPLICTLGKPSLEAANCGTMKTIDEDRIYDDIYAFERTMFSQMPLSLKLLFNEYPPYIYEKRLLRPLPPSLKVLFQDPEHEYEWKNTDELLLKPHHATIDSNWEFPNMYPFLVKGQATQPAAGLFFGKCWFCGHHIITKLHNCRRENLKKHLQHTADNVKFHLVDFCEDIKLEIDWVLYKFKYELFAES